LTHRDLELRVAEVDAGSDFALADGGRWFAPEEWPALGLPAPIARLLGVVRKG
jgi:A/G-specific adenine glycosylase